MSDPEAPVTGETDTSTPEVQKLAAFAMQGARYFESRPTGGEDAAHWANVTNAETMRKIARCTAALAAERDAALSRAEVAEARASEHGAYRSAASAFLATKGLSAEFDAWLSEPGWRRMPSGAWCWWRGRRGRLSSRPMEPSGSAK